MTVIDEGKFLLYSYITPALKAADYRFGVSQKLSATKDGKSIPEGDLPVDSLSTHVRVTAPRYQLPPDQVLSTFPPAGTEGSYGNRLPQIVIKRRTLPWERGLTMPDGSGAVIEVDEKTPWLALVLIAEGEADLVLNQDVGKCISSDVVLEGERDVAKGNCLVIRKSMLEKILPTRKDVPLLAHARQVDIHDTELMMGDDDGFLSVVICNRLPVPGTDANGKSVPVKYMACLINLEGQFHRLIPQAPPARDRTDLFGVLKDLYVGPSVFDHVAAGDLVEHWGDPVINPVRFDADGAVSAVGHVAIEDGGFGGVAGGVGGMAGGVLDEAIDGPEALAVASSAAYGAIKTTGAGLASYSAQKGHAKQVSANVYEKMANEFAHAKVSVIPEPHYTFPVLLHWSFVSTGDVTFESLMRGLDSGLLGTTPEHPQEPTGREPLEVVETGHVGLTHRTRRGDTVRAWYRGPLLPHPSSGERLPIAHASDQLRAVIPDGREDISLAAAFEIGRLLALSRPAMVASLLRWRQTQFQAARAGSIRDGFVDQFPFGDLAFDDRFRGLVEGKLRELITFDPDGMIGPHRPPVGPGDPIDWGGAPLELLGKGFGIEVDLASGLRDVTDLAPMVAQLRNVTPPVVGRFDDIGKDLVSAVLHGALDATAEQAMSNVLANEIQVDPVLGSTVLRTPDVGKVVDRPGGVISGLPGGVIVAPGSIVTGPGGVVTGPGGMVTGPGGVVTGPGGMVTGSGGLVGGLGVVVPHGASIDDAEPPRRRRRPRARSSASTPDALDVLLSSERRSGTGEETPS